MSQYVRYPAASGGGGGSGSVTSVGLAAPGSILSVTGSPVTNSGTLVLSLVNQNANTVWAGPTTGSASSPSFRMLVSADLPSISSGLSGILPIANGGTGSSTQNFVDLSTVQSVGGAKTFTSTLTASGQLNADGSLQRSTSGSLNIGTDGNSPVINLGNGATTVNVPGTYNINSVTNLNVTNKIITTNVGGSAGSGSDSGLEVEENALVAAYNRTSSDRNSWVIKAPATAGIVTLTPGSGGITLDQSSHNPVTIAAVGSTPNANGLTLAGQVLNLEPASAAQPGILTTGAQSIAGAKTFTGSISASNLSGSNTGDITLDPVGSTPGANGASLVNQVLTLQPADSLNPGLMSIVSQSFSGDKTFSNNIVITGSTTLNSSLMGPLKAMSGAVSSAPIDLSAEVTAILPLANGGTGLSASGTAGNILTSNGSTWVSAAPAIAALSQVVVNTQASYGSIGMFVVVYSNIEVNTGTAITYTSDATNGDYMTVNSNGIYAIFVNGQTSVSANFGVSINASSSASSILALANSQLLALQFIQGGAEQVFSRTTYLNSGDIIRIQTDGSALNTSNAFNRFEIVKVA